MPNLNHDVVEELEAEIEQLKERNTTLKDALGAAVMKDMAQAVKIERLTAALDVIATADCAQCRRASIARAALEGGNE